MHFSLLSSRVHVISALVNWSRRIVFCKYVGGGPKNISYTNTCKRNIEGHRSSNIMDGKPPKSTKPPNILIYTGQDGTNSSLKYTALKKLFAHCVNRDAYTIYQLKHDQLCKTPWQNNTVLLVISCVDSTNETNEMFLSAFLKKTNILSFRSSFENKLVNLKESCSPESLVNVTYKIWNNVHLMSSKTCFCKEEDPFPSVSTEFICSNNVNGESLVALVTSETSKAALVQVYLEDDGLGPATSEFVALKESNTFRLEILRDLLMMLDIDCSAGKAPELTPAFLSASSEKVTIEFLKCIQGKLKDKCLKSKDITLNFVDCDATDLNVTDLVLPVVSKSTSNKFQYFDTDVYWENLKTCSLGHLLLYADVIPTTMKVLDGLMFCTPENVGAIAIAGRQTSGKGRGGNSWLSPIGCAMFSLHVRIDLNSVLGRKVTFLQHIISLAVVQSVRSLPDCRDLPLKLKWPNDIYYGRNMKLGGVIVNSTMMGSILHAVIGCGFNVTNSNPTICINDIIQNHNSEHGKQIPPCSVEQLIARTVSETEHLIQLFQTQGSEAFCQLYYKNWMHSGDTVKVECLEFLDATVDGLDDFGYLQVKDENGKLHSLQPDGNSFDIMHNLIAIKTR